MEWAVLIAVGLGVAAFFAAGCACCGCSARSSDSFSGSSLGAGWDVRSGTWTVSGGAASSSSSNAVAVYLTPAKPAGGRGLWSVGTSGTYVQGTLRFIGAYSDDDNYMFAEVTFPSTSLGNDGSARLYSRIAGVETLLEEVSSGVQFSADIEMCWTGSVVTVRAWGAIGTYDGAWDFMLAHHVVIEGEYIGIGTAAGTSGSLRFNSAAVASLGSGVNCEACGSCATVCTDGLPDTIEVTLPSSWSDLGASARGCTTCDETFNGATFVLSRIADLVDGQDQSDYGANCLSSTRPGYGSCWYYYDHGEYCSRVISGTTYRARLELYAYFEVDAPAGSSRRLKLYVRDYGDLADWWQQWRSDVLTVGECLNGSWTLNYFQLCDGGSGLGSDLTFDSCDFNFASPGTISAVAA